MKTAVCSIAAKNYLAHARVLFESVARHAPEARRVLLLVDRPEGHFDPAAEGFEFVLSEDLGIPNSTWFHFKYNLLELSTAVKPYLLEALFERHGVEQVVYLDPDILVCASLDAVWRRVHAATAVLTPHLTAPLDDGFQPGELEVLRSGAYNLGFFGIRDCAEARRLLDWWQQRLYDRCLADPASGLFVDQKWMDLAPGLFEGVAVERDPGWNVAYWNLPHREVQAAEQGYRVNGRPLVFFHFSGFDPLNPEPFSRHQNRLRLSGLGGAGPLAREYGRRLLAAGYAECHGWQNAYARFANGTPVPDTARALYRAQPDYAGRVSDPFSGQGYDEFLRLCNEPGPAGGAARLTRLAEHIYRSRPELQSVFPDPAGRDALGFLTWLLTYGRAEFGLGEEYLAPLRREWRRQLRASGASGAAHLARYWLLRAAVAWRRRAARPQSVENQDRNAPARQTGALNLAGYLRAEMGVGESARLAAAAAGAAGLKVYLKDVPSAGPHRLGDPRAGEESTVFPARVTLYHVNADQTAAVLESLGEFSRRGYNIGYWAWELEEFPARWWGAFDLLDEVWTPSTFTQEAVARSAPLPVVRVPHAVQVHLDERLGRAALGLPEQGFLFLAMCDVLSVARRKNPLGAIEAFRQAAGGMPDAHLAIKLSYGAERPAEVEELRRAAAGLPVTFIDRLFSRNEVNNLLACCDCLVSLHRSEGFGLALAEAMALGKPVLATAYSGNMDFTRPGLAFLAEYRLREVGPGAEPYDASCLWAEPDTGQAARLMGEIFSQPERRAEVAARGQQFVRRHFSPRAVGELMKRRLELIERRETRNQKA